MTQCLQVGPFVRAALRQGHDMVDIGGQLAAAVRATHRLIVQYQLAQALPRRTVASGR
jgi:hypothetical protein